MKSYLGPFLRATLFVIVIGLMAAPATVSAQAKKGKGKGLSLQIYKDKGGKYRYRLQNADGKSLAIASSGIKSKAQITSMLSTFKKGAAKAKVVDEGKKPTTTSKTAVYFELYKDKGGKYRYRIKSGDGESLGRSSIGYTTKTLANAAISAIQTGIAAAEMTDDSKK